MLDLVIMLLLCLFCFFFQAEDGIRDIGVTGVQTCALPIWADDPATDVIALYLESLGNPRKFARITRRVGRQKPILVVKSGRSTAGTRATSSHTGALLGASDVTVDALFKQAGVIRTD